MKVWLKDKGYGFVTGSQGEEFYLSAKGLVYNEDAALLSTGVEVAFTIAPALRENSSRRAVTALVAGADADGKLAFRHSSNGYGFITVTDNFGATISVHVQIPNDAQWRVGTDIAFTVATDPRGPRALDPELVDDAGSGQLKVVGAA